MDIALDPEVLAGMIALGIPMPDEPPPAPTVEMLEVIRARMLETLPLDLETLPGVVRVDRVIPGGRDDPDVAVRIFSPAQDRSSAAPGVVWMHGGGYIGGSYDMHVELLDRLVLSSGCVAVSVNYRLAPETPFPGPLNDCYAALSFILDEATELGVDTTRIAVGGRSAGGGLAAALALLARDRGVPLVHQHLIFPMLDDRQLTPSSRWNAPIWPVASNTFGWRCYLSDLYGNADIPAYAAPARADDLSGVAPAYIHIGGADGFLHESIAYAAQLTAAGVPTEFHLFPGSPHGFDSIAPDARVAKTANSLSEAALTRALLAAPASSTAASTEQAPSSNTTAAR